MRALHPTDTIKDWARECRVDLITSCVPEVEPIRGNAMASGDDKYDRSVEGAIARSLAQGNDWAWCTVTVVAKHTPSGLRGYAHLGCCSYPSQEEFERSGILENMQREACEDLVRVVAVMRVAICGDA